MRLFFILLFMTFYFVSYGQIKISKVRDLNYERSISTYDSLNNFLGNDVRKYIGQELYLNGKPESLRKYGYRDFYIDFESDLSFDQSNVYKCCNSGLSSIYDSMANRYFKVLEVIKHPKSDNDDLIFKEKYFFKLEEKDSKDIVYYEYDSRFESSFPFISVGFFEKLKSRFIGNKFILRGRNWISDNEMTDINTGKIVSDFKGGKVWNCIDVSIEDEYYQLSLIIENSKREQIPLSVDRINDDFWVVKLNDSKKYVKKFGLENWSKIIDGKVKIGMSKEMCLISWGKPQKINETFQSGTKFEQWLYTSRFYPNGVLYFKNGVLIRVSEGN